MNLADYPTGFVTIVFTDIVGSTRMTNKLNATERERYETVLRNPHRDRLFALLKQHGGHEIQRAGDGHMVVFAEPQQAIACLMEFQTDLRADPIRVEVDGEEFVVRVRAGIHTTERIVKPQLKEENGNTWIEYPGRDTNFAARISAIGDGEQILLSQSAYDRAKPEILQLRTHSWHDRFLKSFEDTPQTVHELLYYDGQEPREPGLRFFSAWYQDERNRYIPRETKEDAVTTRFSNPVRGKRPRLVTIHAGGGMGKTRLSIACALKMAGIFGNDMHFVKLGETAPNPYAVAEAIGSVLGKSGPQAQPDALCESLRHAHLLLLLDNYESCAHDEVAHFLNSLISQTTGVHLLVTGRQTVGVRNVEQVVSLEAGLTHLQARELFLERASLDGQHQQALTHQEDEQLNRILRLVSVNPKAEESGPIPLAVELAAAWWSEKKLKEIADGLEATPLKKYMGPVPGMVADDHAEAQGRHDSLDRSLTWSYDLLGKVPDIGGRLQRTFALCGLFPEAFDAEIVQQIGGDPESDDLLIRLHRASMLQERGTQERTLYRLHHFSREYAREKLLEIPDGTELKSKFIAYYANLIARHADINQLSNHPILDASWRNTLAAAQWAMQTQNYPALFQLVGGSFSFFQLRGILSELESLYLQVLDLMRKTENKRGESRTLNNLGIVYRVQNRWQEAEQAYKDSLAIKREFKDRIGEATILNNLGIVYRAQNRWQEAEQAHIQNLAIKREFKDRAGESRTLNNLGIVYQLQSRWQEAEQAHQDSLAIKREFKDRIGEAGNLNNLGIFYKAQNRWQEAEQAYQNSLAICREFKDRVGEGRNLNNLGNVYQLQNRWQEAEQVHQDSLTIFREFKDRVGEGQTLNNLGSVYRAQNRWQEAEQAYKDSLAIKREFKDRLGEGGILANIALLREAQEDLVGAVNFARQAVQALSGTQAVAELEEAQTTLARIEGKMEGNDGS